MSDWLSNVQIVLLPVVAPLWQIAKNCSGQIFGFLEQNVLDERSHCLAKLMDVNDPKFQQIKELLLCPIGFRMRKLRCSMCQIL